ncbi:MAG: serine hydrolase domain-containing protein, partial [Chloroflexota bacterium]
MDQQTDPTTRAEALITQAAGHMRAPGLAAAVIYQGQLALVVEHGSATPEARFRLGPLTQVITALAVLRLAAEGLINLDAPVNSYLQTLQIDSPAPVTARHLLSHTAGLGAAQSVWRVVRGAPTVRAGETPPTVPDYFGGRVRAHTMPGSKWRYTADGYAILGQMIADLTGRSFDVYAHQAIFEQMHLRGASFAPPDDALRGHVRAGKRARPTDLMDTPLRAAVGAWASLDDLIRLTGALLDHGRTPDHAALPPKAVDMLYT